jgi:hypothetical protein
LLFVRLSLLLALEFYHFLSVFGAKWGFELYSSTREPFTDNHPPYTASFHGRFAREFLYEHYPFSGSAFTSDIISFSNIPAAN